MSDVLIFLVVQAMVINGIHISFKGYKQDGVPHGNIFYLLFAHKWSGDEWWQKPLYSCVKCMASVWGALTFWPVVVYNFGFDIVQVPLFIADVFALSYLNWFFYKLS
jgi:hypothetical protein